MGCHGLIETAKFGIFLCHAGKQTVITCRDQVIVVGYCTRKTFLIQR
jgi:hypothetical protein